MITTMSAETGFWNSEHVLLLNFTIGAYSTLQEITGDYFIGLRKFDLDTFCYCTVEDVQIAAQ